MTRFLVEWAVDIDDARTPLQAAIHAFRVMQTKGTTANCFTVKDFKSGVVHNIDLEGDIVDWVPPSANELELEWKTETLESLFFSGYPRKKQLEKYKNHFFNYFNDFTYTSEVFQEEIREQLYLTNTLEQLADNIQHMGKDVSAIAESIECGQPTTPLFILNKGKLKILGGRTRATIAYMNGHYVLGTIISKGDLDRIFYPLRRNDFLECGCVLSVFETKNVRAHLLDCIEGKTTVLPQCEVIPQDKVAEEIVEIKKYMGVVDA